MDSLTPAPIFRSSYGICDKFSEADSCPPTVEKVRKCQKAAGEVLWLVTRTRPDIMFAVARMGANVTRATKKVMETAAQLWGFLKKTNGEGLRYEELAEEEPVIQVFTDASFAPEGEESHGAYLVMVGRCPLFWRSGRQASVPLSTGEAELSERYRGPECRRVSFSFAGRDRQRRRLRGLIVPRPSAFSQVREDHGEHAIYRSSYARQAILGGEWGLNHLPGEKMIPDMGAKAQTSPRIGTLKKLMGMGQKAKETGREEKGSAQYEEAEQKTAKMEQAANAVRLITLATILSMTKAQGEEGIRRR